MSDVPPEPGWWKASDGNWYPPQPPQAPVPPSKGNKGCLIAAVAVFGLFALTVIAAVLAIFFLGNRAADKLSAIGSEIEAPATVDPDNAEERDKMAELGGSVRLSGYTATVESAEVVVGHSQQTDRERLLIVAVTIVNRDDRSQSYSASDWSLQAPDGQILDPVSVGERGLLAGELAKGEKVSATLTWRVGDTTGDFFIIYKPDFYEADRGVWRVPVSG